MVCGARREHRTSALAARARRSHAIVPSPNYALGAPDEAGLADIGCGSVNTSSSLPAVDRGYTSCKALPGPRRIVRRAIVCVVPR